MANNSYGNNLTITTWGESHGKALGVVVDGCPAGLELSEEDIQAFLDRRKPGQSDITTPRKEDDKAVILSGVFEGKTTGCPISIMVENKDQRSRDYSNVANVYRPGHADYTFSEKYGFRDYRGGGRSSGRETIGRVAAGAICSKILKQLGISIECYTKSIGNVEIEHVNMDEVNNAVYMPDSKAAVEAQKLIKECMANENSIGGMIECRVKGTPVGVGGTVFNKLDARLAQAMLSIGAVKGFEIGDGFEVATALGSDNNDEFVFDGSVHTSSNHAGGVLGGMSSGEEIVFRVPIKPTPSISREQSTVNDSNENVKLEIKGRHDPVIVPRAVVVVESMTAITLVDLLMENMNSRMEYLEKFYK